MTMEFELKWTFVTRVGRNMNINEFHALAQNSQRHAAVWCSTRWILDAKISAYCPSLVPVQTDFQRYIYYISLNQAQTHLDHLKVLGELWSKISIGFDNRWRISPIAPNCKIARFRQRYDVTESGRFLQWGSMGKLFTRCRFWIKFHSRVLLKPSNDRDESELDWARCYNTIAENLFVLGHETNQSKNCYILSYKGS